MIEMTDINLDAFIIRELRNVVAKHPRFKNLGGDISSYFSTQMRFNDLEVLIKNASSAGTRLSPDHFMATQYGRTVLAKLGDKDGAFIEFIQEVDKKKQNPAPGIYYLNLDSIDEKTRDVSLTCAQVSWKSGSFSNAVGSIVFLSKDIDPSDVGVAGMTETDDYLMLGYRIAILKFTDTVALKKISDSTFLTPIRDYWVVKELEYVLTSATTSGFQTLILPATNYESLKLVDSDGYELRENIDYYFSSPTDIVLSSWTPAGLSITAVGLFRQDPRVYSPVSPENKLDITLGLGEQIIQDQVIIETEDGIFGFDDIVIASDNTIWLKNLLKPGQNLKWDVRINIAQITIQAKKNAMNLNFLPGLNVAIGDKTIVDDQIAIIVYPYVNETYEIYGSKENVSFDIEIKTNDSRTSSEIGQLIKEHLLVRARERVEAAGLTIYEISRTAEGEIRDPSNTTSSQYVRLTIQGAADWEVRMPLITRLTNFDIEEVKPDVTFPGKMSILPITRTYEHSRFITSYS